MSLSNLVNHATDKERFHTVNNYIDFCARYLEYVETGLQARIVSQNESHYQFFQYKQYGNSKVFNSFDKGYRFCGKASSCECAKESVSKKSKESQLRIIYTNILLL